MATVTWVPHLSPVMMLSSFQRWERNPLGSKSWAPKLYFLILNQKNFLLTVVLTPFCPHRVIHLNLGYTECNWQSWATSWLSELQSKFLLLQVLGFFLVNSGHSFPSKEQASFNFVAAVTICSNFGAPRNKACHCFPCFPIYLLLYCIVAEMNSCRDYN